MQTTVDSSLFAASDSKTGFFCVFPRWVGVCSSPERLQSQGVHGHWVQNNVQSPCCDLQLHTGVHKRNTVGGLQN